jgi:RHS repeat-associated protein
VLRKRALSVLAGTVSLAVIAAGAPAVAQPVPPNVTSVIAATLLGDRPAFTMLRRDLSDRSQLAVNVATGNVVYEATDFDIAGVGQRLTIERFLNSTSTNGVRPNPQLPGNWRISVGADVAVTVAANGDVRYLAPDGSTYDFTKQSDGSFTAPAGINAKLSTSDSTTYTLRFNRTGITDTFVVSGGAGSIRKSADRDGNTITFNYGDPGGIGVTQLVSIVDTQGRTVSLTYGHDGAGPLTLIRDSTGRTVHYNYDTGGALSSVQDTAGKITQYSYEGTGLSLITSPDGHQTAIDYSGASNPSNPGRVDSVTYGADGDSSTTTFAYPDGSTTRVTDGNGHTTTYAFDDRGRVTKTTDALGHSRSRSYTANDDPTTFTDATSAVTTLAYDNQNNLTKVQAPNVAGGAAGSGRSTLLGYPTPTGSLTDFQPTSSTDPQGNQSTYGYNAAGHLSTVNTPAGAGGTLTDKYQGDTGVSCGAKKGELCSSTDGNGHVTSYGYDAAGNLTKVTPPAPLGATTIVPDGLGRPSTVTDGKGQTTAYTYDGADRITQIRYGGATTCQPSGGNCIQYAYDGQGNLISRTDQTATTYSYDAQGRLTDKHLTGPGGSPVHDFQLGYDFAGNLTSYRDTLGEVDYRYDAANRMVALSEPGGACPDTPVFPNTTHCTGFSYDNNDRRTKISFPSGQSNSYSYDTSGRMTEVSANNGATVLRSEQYDYTRAGKDTAILQTLTPNAGSATTYLYDPLNRLTGRTTGSTTGTYTYDKAGNRTTFALTGAAKQFYTYNAADELCFAGTTSGTDCASPPTGSTRYSYDGNGNVTAAGSTAYTYNNRNQTTQVGGTTFAYTDADSAERYRRSSANESTTFFNSPLGVTAQGGGGKNVAFTRDPDGNLVDMRVSDLGASNYQSNYATTDRLGSTLLLTDQAVATTASYSYDPYGVTTSTGSNAATNPFRFAGGLADPTGLVKYGTRYTDPNLGRWTQRDPVAGSIADPGAVNRYPYVQDQPTNKVDRTGRVTGCSGGLFAAGVIFDTDIFALELIGAITGPVGFAAGLVIDIGLFATEQIMC